MSTVVQQFNKKPNKIVFGTCVVNRIDNPFDPLCSKVSKTDLHGSTLDKYLDGYCLGAEIKVVVNGKLFTEAFDSYIVHPNDNITYTYIVQGGGGGGSGKQILTVVAMIALTVATMGATSALVAGGAFAAGSAGAIAFTAGMMIAGSMIINAVIGQGVSNTISGLINTPSLESSTYSWNGITTSRDINSPIPILYGTHALGGTVINSRFYYKGTDDWLATQIALCHGEIENINNYDISINDSKYISFISQNEYTNGYYQYRNGEFNQTVMTGYDDSFYNNASVAREIKYNVPYTFESVSTNIDFFRLHIAFPEGLYNIDTSTGNKTAKQVILTASYRKKGTSTWIPIYSHDSRGTIEYKYTYNRYYREEYYDSEGNYYTSWGRWVTEEMWSTSLYAPAPSGTISNFTRTSEFRYNPNIAYIPSTEIVFMASSSVPIKQYLEPVNAQGTPILLEPAQYEFLVNRLTVDDVDGNAYEKSTSTVRFLEEVNSTNINYSGIALLGIDLKATDQLNSSRPNFVTVCRRKPLLLNGVYRNSDNPAWVCLDMLTNTNYGMGLSFSEIDLPEFTNWAMFCDAEANGTFSIAKSVPNTDARHIYGNNCIIVPFSDFPQGQLLGSVSQIDLNQSSIAVKVYRTSWGSSWTSDIGIISGVSYVYLPVGNPNGLPAGQYCLLQLKKHIVPGEPLTYNLVIRDTVKEYRPKLKFNGVFDTSSDVWSALQDAAQVGRGQVILRGNKYSCIYDSIKTVKGLYNSANSNNCTVQYINNADIANEIELQFSDKSINYEMNSISIQDADAMASGVRSNKTTRQVKGITSEEEALVYGRYLLATSKYIRRIVTLDADIEAITQTVGDLIAVQTDVTQYGTGGLVDKVLGNFVYLDNTVTLEKGKTYTVKIKDHFTDVIREFSFVAESSTNEMTFDSLDNVFVGDLIFDDFIIKMDFESEHFIDTSVIVLTGTFDVNKDDRYSFGIQGSDSILCTITNIDRDGEYNRKITAVEYNASILDFNYNNDTIQRITPLLKPKNIITNFKANDRLVKLAAGQVVAMVSFGWEALVSSYYNIFLLEEGGFKHYLGNNIKETRFEYPNTVMVPDKAYTIYIEDLNDPSITSTMQYTVTAFASPPEDISSVSLSSANANVIFKVNYPNKPLDFAYYNVYRDNILISTQISDTFELRHIVGGNTVTYYVEAVDMIKKVSLHKASAVFTPSVPIINTLDYLTTGENIKLSISAVRGSFDIDYYTLTYNGTQVITKDLTVLVKANFTGTKTFSVKATDVLGNTSVVFNRDVTITVPSPSNVKSTIEGKEAVISWDIPNSVIPIDYYELTYDTFTVKTKTSSFRLPVMWGGSKTFTVATVNTLGAKSSTVTTTVAITTATVTSVQVEVIDNNVLLRWSATQGSLPIDNFVIYKGPNINSLVSIGEKMGTFTTIFETTSGTYVYWVGAVDSAGNVGTKVSASASVNQPPDYILNVKWNSTFSGTKSNAKIDAGYLVLPINTTETIQQHFVNNSWTTAQAQINAGSPLWIQPFLSTGYYEESFDYGAILPSSSITLNLDKVNVVGTPIVTPTISVSSNGSTWIDYPNQYQVYGAGFRYIKIRVTVTGTNSGLLLKALEVKLDSKIKNDSGSGYSAAPIISTSLTGNGTTGTCTFATQPIAPYKVGETIEITGVVPSTWNNKYIIQSCSTTSCTFSSTTSTTATTQGTINAGGSIVYFNTPFVDITSISVTPSGTTPIIAIYDFLDVGNPTYFKVLLYDTSGVRVNGNYSWGVKGY